MQDTGTPTPVLIRRPEACRLLGGMAERTFAKLEADGVIVPTVRGSGRRPSEYDPFTIVPAYLGYLKTGKTASGDREARARRDRSQADLNELRLLEARKELLPRAQVVRDGKAFIVAAKAKLRALPRRMAQAGLVTLEQQPAVADLIREALEEMARWRKGIDLVAAAKGDA
ncbi:MAG: hypothetical protein ACE147_00560 [Candidatus Methylomirabilales bacterium]